MLSALANDLEMVAQIVSESRGHDRGRHDWFAMGLRPQSDMAAA
jgi:hypothetical protein